MQTIEKRKKRKIKNRQADSPQSLINRLLCGVTKNVFGATFTPSCIMCCVCYHFFSSSIIYIGLYAFVDGVKMS